MAPSFRRDLSSDVHPAFEVNYEIID
jgi:hypothetical protein